MGSRAMPDGAVQEYFSVDGARPAPETGRKKEIASMVMLWIALAALVQDPVDNPEYKGWAAFKPGSSVTYKVQIGENPALEQKSVLKSVADEELVLAVEMSAAPGRGMERKVPAKVPAEKAPRNVKEARRRSRPAARS
jgi:hypothetical protein